MTSAVKAMSVKVYEPTGFITAFGVPAKLPVLIVDVSEEFPLALPLFVVVLTDNILSEARCIPIVS